MNAAPLWHIRSGMIDELVLASDQYAAWNTLRHRPTSDFGLIVTAEPNENGDPVAIRTSMLMYSWGRSGDGDAFIETALARGLPDTRDRDMGGIPA